jgi:hypothetical protein
VDTLSESVTITDFLYRDIFCQRCVCSYMLLLVILIIDCLPNNVIMIRIYGGDMERLKERWRCKGAAKAAKPSWSPNPSRAEIQFGFEEQSAPKLSPRSHTNSVLNILYMDGKIRG